MAYVEVHFKDPRHDYITSVSSNITEEEVIDYFLGEYFDVGSYPVENLQMCIDVIFKDG